MNNLTTERLKKLEALEKLIMSLTHDMNNALSVIKLETESLSLPALHRKINDLASMIRTLQTYSRSNACQ